MTRRRFQWLLVLGVGWTVASLNIAAAAQGGPDLLGVGADGAEVEVLTRGPVHEAFAEPVTFDSSPGIVVRNEPPPLIEELPPDQRPEGDNVAWIPGYWAWDDDREHFLWVSGIWRVVPPDRQWVPGYWTRTGAGFQWISGYWADAGAGEIEYLPEPPETIEAGPTIAAPSPDHIWIPGSWVWQHSRFVWRPGDWARVYPDWIWIPAHYVWTPCGYVFVEGYWDYVVPRRGVLFAPVYFGEVVYARRGFGYSPSIVIDAAVLTDYLFCRPHHRHYYFGDYYAAEYLELGIFPWFSFHYSRHGYDPIYAYYRWQHLRADRDWELRVEADYRHRREHPEARPPQTFAAQSRAIDSRASAKEQKPVLAKTLAQVAESKDASVRLQPLDESRRKEIGERGKEALKAREERRKVETEAAGKKSGTPSKDSQPVKVALPKSPIVAKPGHVLGKDVAVPAKPPLPDPDLKAQPKPKKAEAKLEPSNKGEPKPKKGEPKPESPKGEAKPKKDEPKPEPPKAEPKPKKGEPKPEPTKGESKEKPRGESKEKPKDEPKEKNPKQESKEKPKGEAKSKKEEPRPEWPQAEPKSKKGEPKAEPRKDQPRVKDDESRPERPKPEPKTPKVDSKPQPPKSPPATDKDKKDRDKDRKPQD